MLTDNVIKKALECCTTNGASCKDCPAFIKVDRSNCKKYFRGALDLINRLEARVEKREKVEHFADKTIATLQAENERLKENLNIELENFATEYDNKIKAEAYKECIEKVKAENYDRCIDVVYDGSGEVKRVEIRQALFNKQLDNLYKELVGEDK